VVSLLEQRARHLGLSRTEYLRRLLASESADGTTATAELTGLTVLHHDKNFDLIAEFTGQPIE
jgi:predicted nucleic acid-binding protein